MNTAKTKKDELTQQAERDFAFEQKLSNYSKATLTMALAHMSSNENTRSSILNIVESMDQLMDAAKINDHSLRDSIFHAINQERLTQDEMNGPIKMNPRTLPEWTDRLQRLLTKATTRANYGQDLAAMKIILWIARDAVACLEDRIDSVADHHKDSLQDAINKVMQRPEENINQLLEMGKDISEDVELTTLREITGNGVAYRGHYYWASWMSNMQGNKVKIRFPGEARAIHVIDAETEDYLGEAYRMKVVDNSKKDPTDDATTSPAGEAESTNEG